MLADHRRAKRVFVHEWKVRGPYFCGEKSVFDGVQIHKNEADWIELVQGRLSWPEVIRNLREINLVLSESICYFAK